MAVNPSGARGLSEVDGVISKWEEDVKTLDLQFKETLTDPMKMAIFTNMMPSVIQDYIYTHVDAKWGEAKYDELRDKVKAMVSNKLASSMGPAPMDMGGVDGRAAMQDGDDEDDAWYDEELGYYVQAMSSVKCWSCGKDGHLAKDCYSSPKGKSKGKGNFPSHRVQPLHFGSKTQKGKGEKGKGKGKGGFQCSCWNCGAFGHSASRCTSTAAASAVETAPEAPEVVVGSVYTDGWVMAVNGVELQPVAKFAPSLAPDTNTAFVVQPLNFVSKNSFGALASEEDCASPTSQRLKQCSSALQSRPRRRRRCDSARAKMVVARPSLTH